MADTNPPGTIQQLQAAGPSIADTDIVLHLLVRPNQQYIYAAYMVNGAQEKRMIDLGIPDATPIPPPAGTTATTTDALNARDLPKLSGSKVLKVLAKGTVVTLGDSAPVQADGITWRRIVAPLAAWVSEKYLQTTAPAPQPGPVLPSRLGLSAIASGEGIEQRELEEVIGMLRAAGKELGAVCMTNEDRVANWLKGISPQTFLVFRYRHTVGPEEISPGDPRFGKWDARLWFDTCWPVLSKVPRADAYQFDNEHDPQDPAEYARYIQYNMDLMDIATAHGIKITILNTGAGRPDYFNPGIKELTDRAIQKAIRLGHYVGVHLYTSKDHPDDILQDWDLYHGRVVMMAAANPGAKFLALEFGTGDGTFRGNDVLRRITDTFFGKIGVAPWLVAICYWVVGGGALAGWLGHDVRPFFPVFVELA